MSYTLPLACAGNCNKLIVCMQTAIYQYTRMSVALSSRMNIQGFKILNRNKVVCQSVIHNIL